MVSMMGTALLELPHRLWNLFKSNGPNFPDREVSQELVIKQGNQRKLDFVPVSVLGRLSIGATEAVLELEVEDYTMARKSVENYKGRTSLESESESEEFDNVEIKNEQLWEGSQLEPHEHVTIKDEGYEDWSPQELDFFNSLNDRGITPMLWSYWKLDFPTLPKHLFTAEKEDALIKNWKGLPSTGAKALNTLVQAGIYARERRRSGQNAAQLLAKEITRYIKWSFKDAKWQKDIYFPLIVVNFARKNEELEVAEARGQARVRGIGEQYKDLWEQAEPELDSPPPTIFHIFLAKTIMGFESYDCSAENPEFRSIFFTDWKQFGHDIWNAMAVAILVEQCRLWLAKVDPKRPKVTEIIEIDPDL